MILLALWLCSPSASTIFLAEPLLAAGLDRPAGATEAGVPGTAEAAGDSAAAKKPAPPPPLFPLEAAWSFSLKTPLTVWPAYDESSMYVALSNGELVALSMTANSATQRWAVPNIEATFPLAADGQRVYAATDDAVHALEASKGTSLWHHPAGGRLSTAPVARAGWLILALDTGDVRALRGESGDEVWKLPLGAPVKSEPLIDGNRLYLTPENNRIVAVDLISGKVLWDRDMGAIVNSVAAFQDGVYVGTTGRMFYALADRDGQQRWKWRIGNDAVGRSLFTDTRVYVIFMDNSIRAFGLDNGGQRWRQPLDFRAHAGALRIEETIVVVGLSPVLRGYRTDTGKPAGNFTLPVGPQAQVAAPLRFVQGGYFLDDLIVTVTQEGDIVAARRKAAPVPAVQSEPFGLLGEPIVWPIPAAVAPGATSAAPPPNAPAPAAGASAAGVPAPGAPASATPASKPPEGDAGSTELPTGATPTSATPASEATAVPPPTPPVTTTTSPSTAPPVLP